jgi:Flp pilus assembly protein TadD
LLALLAAPAQAARTAPARLPPLHAYVIGRYAALGSEMGLAAQLMEQARAADPDATNVARRSFELALAAGDAPRTFALARSLPLPDTSPGGSAGSDADVAMVRLADALIRRDPAAAATARTRLVGPGWPQVAAPIADAWVAMARGDTAAALAALDLRQAQGVVRAYLSEHRAHVLAAAGRWDEAALAYRQTRAMGGGAPLFLKLAQADALVMAGRRDEALALLAPVDQPTAAARRNLVAGRRPGALVTEARQGLAWLAMRLAGDLAREQAQAPALAFARLSSFLAPEQPAPWLLLADLLVPAGQPQAALAALDRLPAGNLHAAQARARRADALARAGRTDAGRQLLAAAAAAPDASADDWSALADWHRDAGQVADAIGALDGAIAHFGEAVPVTASHLHLQRAMLHDRAGNWPAADKDLHDALLLTPDDPVALNYLGYSLLERGDVATAAPLIERAAALRPGDGGIIDSLGWLQLRRGRLAEAVVTLERAAQMEPGDPSIIGHLGDAYWQQGRRIEARFRWRQALTMEPETGLRRQLQARLDYGLDAAPAMLAQR